MAYNRTLKVRVDDADYMWIDYLSTLSNTDMSEMVRRMIHFARFVYDMDSYADQMKKMMQKFNDAESK
jgi:hypothetical protein